MFDRPAETRSGFDLDVEIVRQDAEAWAVSVAMGALRRASERIARSVEQAECTEILIHGMHTLDARQKTGDRDVFAAKT